MSVARRLGAAGYGLILQYHTRSEEIESLAVAIRVSGSAVVTVRVDLTSSTEVEELAEVVDTKFGPLGGLVHVASPRIRPAAPMDVADKEFEAHLQVQALSLAQLCRIALPPMQRAQSGVIIGILSTALEPNRPKLWWPYVASKFALWGILAGLSADVEGSGVRVVGVMPSGVDTELGRAANAGGALLGPDTVAAEVEGAIAEPGRYPNGAVVRVSPGEATVGRFEFVGRREEKR